MGTFIGWLSSAIPQESATNAWWHEVGAPRAGEDDFRGVRKEPAAFQKDTLVERKDQGRTKTEEPDRAVEHHERKPHIENRIKMQPAIYTATKHRGLASS